MAQVIAVANQKGGVGKTTTVVNLAAALALAECRVLVVDLDPQANASSALGFRLDSTGFRVYDAFVGRAKLSEVISSSEHDGLDVIPSSSDLVALEIELVDAAERSKYLRDLLEPVRQDYDVILIDCAPSLGILTVNALVASDWVLVPLQAEYYALEGVSGLLRTVEAVTRTEHPELRVLGFVLTMMDRRNRICHQVAQEAKAHFSKRVFDTIIPRNVRLAEAPSHARTALSYDLNCAGSLAYIALADELISRLEQQKTDPATQAA